MAMKLLLVLFEETAPEQEPDEDEQDLSDSCDPFLVALAKEEFFGIPLYFQR